jgi:integrase
VEPRSRAKRRRPHHRHHLFLRGDIWWCRIGTRRRSTGIPASREVEAKAIRDKWLSEYEALRRGVVVEERQLRPILTVSRLIELYLERECQAYDREGSPDQPGTKRSADTDRHTVKRLRRHLEIGKPAASMTTEDLILLRDRIEREKRDDGTPLAPGTRRKAFALLRRIYSWASKRPSLTGVELSPFSTLDREDRKRMMPRSSQMGQVIPADLLRAIYEKLPAHARFLVRFLAHSGMRPGEAIAMRWGWVDLDRGVVRIDARWAKAKVEREAVLNFVARGVLETIRPSGAKPSDTVFLGRSGKPIKSIRTAWEDAVSKAWQPNGHDRAPHLYDLRHTAISAMERVASFVVTRKFAGHAIQEVTGRYTHASIDEIRSKANEAAYLIDGSPRPGVVEGQFGQQEQSTSHQVAHQLTQPIEIDIEPAKRRS